MKGRIDNDNRGFPYPHLQQWIEKLDRRSVGKNKT